jgi:SAM-dependent methyltransferase
MRIPLLKNQWYFTGFDTKILTKSLRGTPAFLKSLRRYQSMNSRPSFRIAFNDLCPVLADGGQGAGTVGGHYFHQDLWAARKIFERKPDRHVDIGSRIDGFITHLLVFMPVTVVDIRPLARQAEGLTFLQDDATELSRFPDNSVHSISSLHAAEHFGLGRYSDPIDPSACFKFMAALERVLAPGGRLYFSVPIGHERVEFNAHRVFAPQTIMGSFPGLHLLSFSFVGDDGSLYENADPAAAPESEFACGLFEFTKEDA